jgi:hypothetical protein
MELEFLRAHRGRNGQTYVFELLYAGEDLEGRSTLLGLIDCAQLQVPAEPADTTATFRGSEPTFRGEEAHLSPLIRGAFGRDSESFRDMATAFEAAPDEALGMAAVSGEERRSTIHPLAPVPSYPKIGRVNGHPIGR